MPVPPHCRSSDNAVLVLWEHRVRVSFASNSYSTRRRHCWLSLRADQFSPSSCRNARFTLCFLRALKNSCSFTSRTAVEMPPNWKSAHLRYPFLRGPQKSPKYTASSSAWVGSSSASNSSSSRVGRTGVGWVSRCWCRLPARPRCLIGVAAAYPA